jgi:hypothetical protein
VHVYQEAEQLDAREAFRCTVSNFITRLAVALSFVLLVLALPLPWILGAVLAWGMLLLAGLTTCLTRARGASASVEIIKHLGATVVVEKEGARSRATWNRPRPLFNFCEGHRAHRECSPGQGRDQLVGFASADVNPPTGDER